MPEKFIGREAELAALDAAFRSSDSAFVPIYGRRRIGKSELILQFMRSTGGLYFLGKPAPASLQRAEFQRQAALALDEPLLADVKAESWKQAFERVLDRWPRDRKLVLTLDEFQWSAFASPELVSVLQELWDRRMRQMRNVLLILCGSYIGFMEQEVLGRESPLFGRRTGQIHLQPFGFREAGLFHPQLSAVHRAETYYICGGIPMYLRCFASSGSVESNIIQQLLSPFGPLHREPEFLLREELREVETYHAVLEAIAAGTSVHSMVARHAGIEERRLHYYLSQLIALGYVQKSFPLTESQPSTRAVRYQISDPLLRFWFRFLFPNLGFLQQMGPVATLDKLLRPDFAAYFGDCFKRLCREALPSLYRAERVAASLEVGEYWSKQVQIDVVGLRQDGWTDLGECKWEAIKSVPQLAAELGAKVALYPNQRNATIGRRLFVRSASKRSGAESGGCRLHTLADLYES